MNGSQRRYKISPEIDSLSATPAQLTRANSVTYGRMLQVTRELIHWNYDPTNDNLFVYVTSYMSSWMLNNIRLKVAAELNVPIKLRMTSVDDSVEPIPARIKK